MLYKEVGINGKCMAIEVYFGNHLQEVCCAPCGLMVVMRREVVTVHLRA